MCPYRDRLAILADILKAAREGVGKTRIMYQANLSYGLLGKYLGVAFDSGFLVFDGSVFRVTDLGRVFLSKYAVFHLRSVKVEGDLVDLEAERLALKRLCIGTRNESDCKIASSLVKGSKKRNVVYARRLGAAV